MKDRIYNILLENKLLLKEILNNLTSQDRSSCWDFHRQTKAVLTKKNTLIFKHKIANIAGTGVLDFISPAIYNNSKSYLSIIETYLDKLETTDELFYHRIMKMLEDNGFDYQSWRTFIIAAKDNIWKQED